MVSAPTSDEAAPAPSLASASTRPGSVPEPVLPAYGGGCLSNVVPTLLSVIGRPSESAPPWVPAPLLGADQVVLLVLDGLGWKQLGDRPAIAPTLASATGGPITSVAPSTTAAALTSLATGLPPALHGIVGYRFPVDRKILNVLRWQLGTSDARSILPPRSLQARPPFRRPGPDLPVSVVSRVDFASTGFTAAHLGGVPFRGWYTASGLVPEVLACLQRGDALVYAYYDGIDRVAHALGLGSHYDAELRAADRLVADLLESLPPRAALVVTADHGQVDAGSTGEVLGGDLAEAVDLYSGEGRFRWLHTRSGAAPEVLAGATEAFGHLAWVRSRQQVIDDGWLGGVPEPPIADRLGDVALVPFAPTSFLDPADVGEQRLKGRHGSLTPAEMLVPFLTFEPAG